MKDSFGRSIRYLRISVTNRCDLRCKYCMPPGGMQAGAESLSAGEILRLGQVFHRLGVRKFRLTGGEPLLRQDLPALVAGLSALDGARVYLTTNGLSLSPLLPRLTQAGLRGVNISLDTVDPALFQKITGRDALSRVLEAIDAALALPNLEVKVNCVPTLETKEGILPLLEYFKDRGAALRFIELMPIGQGRACRGLREDTLRALIEDAFGPLSPLGGGDGPAVYWAAPGFRGKIGFISALSAPFCPACNRVRLTAEGRLKTCLQYAGGLDLRPLLGGSDEALEKAILDEIRRKPQGHHFSGGTCPGDETRAMHEIGG